MTITALIPARVGSKRIPGKNFKSLAGKPLIQWTIDAANESGIFRGVFVCTDKPDQPWTGAIGVDRAPSEDEQPDIEWVRAIAPLTGSDAFAILRPTSPFRTAETIRRAWQLFQSLPSAYDSLRAVELWDGPHPAKMWYWYDGCGAADELIPVDERWQNGAPRHSSPTQTLPTVVRQNASLEIARTSCVTEHEAITGQRVHPFFTEGWEGFDINTPEDWERAERHAQTLLARL
jgi:CMP-N,N'-diacetyllegionaminic acid synthase